MDLTNKKHVLAFLLLSGFAAYLLGAALDAIFIVGLPMSPGWCLDSQEFSTGPDTSRTECVLFSNALEEMKYHHNKGMVSRNKRLLAFKFLFWAGVAGLAFHWIPKWRSPLQAAEPTSDRGKLLFILALAFAAAIVAPIVFGAILPAPVQWFPHVFRDINDAQVESTLQHLARAASQ